MTLDLIQEIETNINQSKYLISLGDALERLFINQDFKKIIKEGFFEKEAIRLVNQKAEFSAQNAETQGFIIKQMDSIGLLNRYFQNILLQASLAKKAMGADEEARDEILAEGSTQ